MRDYLIHSIDTCFGAHLVSCPECMGPTFVGIRQQGRESGHLLPSNEWRSGIYTSWCVFMTRPITQRITAGTLRPVTHVTRVHVRNVTPYNFKLLKENVLSPCLIEESQQDKSSARLKAVNLLHTIYASSTCITANVSESAANYIPHVP
jgi:hypothetical protein